MEVSYVHLRDAGTGPCLAWVKEDGVVLRLHVGSMPARPGTYRIIVTSSSTFDIECEGHRTGPWPLCGSTAQNKAIKGVVIAFDKVVPGDIAVIEVTSQREPLRGQGAA